MMTLLVLKSKIKNFYEKHYRMARSVLKFLVVLAALLIITGRLDYYPGFENLWLLFAISLICAVTPDVISGLCIFLVICVETAQVSPILTFVILLMMLIYFLLFGRLGQKQYVLIFLVPLMTTIQIGYIVPIVAALFVSPVFLPALAMGVLLQFLINGVAEYGLAVSKSGSVENVLEPLQYLFAYLMRNRLMLVTLASFCLSFLCIYIIRRRKFKYGAQTAILVGAILLMAVELLSNIVWELNLNLFLLLLQMLISLVIAYVIQFFHMTLDYHGTRKLQFEDAEYYYYVTAIPKFKVAAEDKTVTQIVPEEEDGAFDLREELEKALEEERAEKESDVLQ
ncbi:MAG: hypothetical protein J1F22_05805 [Lachnospiraceae bacterium]|nr:hypothetical protein [Lachnospiraceae bacterium]